MTEEVTAPVEETTAPATTEEAETPITDEGTAPAQEQAASAPEDKQNGVQKKINKEVARRGAAERRAEKAEADLKAMQEQQTSIPAKDPVMPKEADYDFDDPKYQADLAQYHRDVATQAASSVIAKNNETTAQNAETAKRQEIETNFWAKADEANIDGFTDKLATLPAFQDDTLDTIMTAENAPELAEYLADHLDVAYEIAGSSSGVAGMKLGQIAARLANKQPTNISNAPDPIDPINQGGAATGGNVDPNLEGATFE